MFPQKSETSPGSKGLIVPPPSPWQIRLGRGPPAAWTSPGYSSLGLAGRVEWCSGIHSAIKLTWILKITIEIVDFPVKDSDFPQLCLITRG